MPDTVMEAGSAAAATGDRSRPDAWREPVALALLVAAVTAAFVSAMLVYTRGHLATPLDDTQIYFQYAKQIAHGEPMIYQPGATASSGATSFAYPFVLAAGYAAGFRDQYLVLFGLAFNAVCLFASAWLLSRIILRLTAHRGLAIAGAGLLAVNGWIGWTYFSMMEVGLHTTVLLAAVAWYPDATSPSRRRAVGYAAVLALLALTRPEMTLLATALGASFAWAAAREHGIRMLALVPVAGALAASAAYFLTLRVVTGSAASDTFAAQSVFAAPNWTVFQMADVLSSGTVENARYSFSWFGFPYVSALAFALFAVGAVRMVADDVRSRRPGPGSLLVVAAVGMWVLGSLAREPAVHQHRRSAAAEPFVIGLTLLGAWELSRRLRHPREALIGVVALLAVGSAFTLETMVSTYGQNSADIYFQQMRAAQWLAQNTPPDARIAINDAGALTYSSRRRTLDIVGLTDRRFARSYKQGPASVLEYIERMPADERPNYLAAYPLWVPFNDPGLKLTSLIRVFSLDRTTIAGGADLPIFTIDPTYLNSGDRPGDVPARAASWEIVDSVDVADLADEEAHGYTSGVSEVGIPPKEVVTGRTYQRGPDFFLDGGRTVAKERFTVRLRDSSKPWIIIGRMASAAPSPVRASTGADAASVNIPVDVEFWRDIALGSGNRSDGQAIQVAIDATVSEYSSFHYWLLQPQ